MTILSTGLRDFLAVSGSLKDALTGCSINIYAGAVPPNADADLGGATLLCSLTGAPDGIEFEDAPVAGVLIKSAAQTWEGTNVASGTATFFRVVAEGDTGGGSTTDVRLQGTVGILGADLEMSQINLVNGEPLAVNSGAFTIPGTE